MSIQTNTGSSLFVAESGAADAPTLIFLHGGGGAGWMWTPQVEALSGEFHCLVPDLPGHGRSAGQPFSIRGAAAQIADMIKSRAHSGKAHIIGLSLGAQVVVALLAAAPEVAHSTLISSALLHSVGPGWLYSPAMLRWTFRLSVTPLKNSAWYARLNMKRAAGVPEAYFEQFRKDFRNATAESFAQIISENMRFRLPDGLKQVLTPALVVVGKREYGVMQQSARELVAELPNGRGVIADVGKNTAENHNWNLTAPDLFTRTVRTWVTGQPLPEELAAL